MKFLSNRNKNFIFKVLTILTGSAIISQLPYFFPDAGKKIEDKSAMYTFQFAHWHNEISKNINIIIETGAFNRIALQKEGLKITGNYCNDLKIFHHQLTQLTRTVGYQAQTVGSLSSEILPSLPRIEKIIDEKRKEEIDSHAKEFTKAMEILPQKKQELTNIVDQIGDKCSSENKGNTTDEQAKKIIEFTSFLQKVYSEKNSPLRAGNDPFKDLVMFGETTDKLFVDYKFMVQKLNEQADQQESYKLALAAFISLLSVLIAFREALEGQRKIDKENAVEI